MWFKDEKAPRTRTGAIHELQLDMETIVNLPGPVSEILDLTGSIVSRAHFHRTEAEVKRWAQWYADTYKQRVYYRWYDTQCYRFYDDLGRYDYKRSGATVYWKLRGYAEPAPQGE